MRSYSSLSPVDPWQDQVKSFLSHRTAQCLGLLLTAFACALAAALASWSVDDPSFNHATSAPVHNLLKMPGAILSDTLMQIFGLGSLALVLPLGLWGWALLRHGRLERLLLRLPLWITGTGAASALASAMPSTRGWPLPSGLGGVTGDALLNAARAITGLTAGAGTLLLGLVFAAIMILCLTACCGFSSHVGIGKRKPSLSEQAKVYPIDAHRARYQPDSYDDETGDDEPGFGIVSLGAVAHGFMRLKSGLSRRLAASRREQREDLSQEDFMPAVPQKGRRREPVFDEAPALSAKDRPVKRTSPEPDHDDVEPAPDYELPVAKSGKAKVTPPAAPIKPAKTGFFDNLRSGKTHEDGTWQLPALGLLSEPKRVSGPVITSEMMQQNAALLEGTLEDFGVRGEIINVRPGPVVTLYELEPAPGTKSSRVITLSDDIARSMSAVSARVAVVQGRNAIGIELPNIKRETVYLRELLAAQDFEHSRHKLAMCLGKTIGGEPVIADLAKMPHLLVAGTTGSGKSVAINTMILSLLYRLKPEECRLIMVDPKMLELSVYDGIPHLLSPVVTDPKKAVIALKWAVREMEDRYRKMSKLGVRNIDGFNERVGEARARGEIITRSVQTGFDRTTGEAIFQDQEMSLDPLPYIVIIVDEMADLMMVAGKDIEGAIQRLAQMARAAGIHIIMATQRPSVDVITGTIKANFPTRISFQVTSKIDSRTILGEMGAEQLLGQGDMLYMAGGGRITRVHGPFVSDDEVEKVVAHLKKQGRPDYLEDVTIEDTSEAGEDGAVFDKGEFSTNSSDPYEQAVAIVMRDKKASTSYIQRRLQVGYNKAASIMERMEKEGYVGPANHAGKREILIESGRDD